MSTFTRTKPLALAIGVCLALHCLPVSAQTEESAPVEIAQNTPVRPADSPADTGTANQTPPAAPASIPTAAPSLDDLGFPKDQTTGNPKDQARLNKRSHMLMMHQRLGLITLAPLVATLVTSGLAVGERKSATGAVTYTPFGRKLHAGLGVATIDLYSTTAMFAIFAPRVPGTATHGGIRAHKILAWVHGSGMVLTPILGALAYQQKNRGEKVHGIASLHPVAAWTTTLSYAAAMVSVSFKF